MESISLAKASQLTSPNPLTLVCTQRPDGKTNVATVSWWTYLSFNPNMVAFAMAKTSYSGERVRETGVVALAMPGTELADVVMGCGSRTGRKTDKVEEFGIAMQELPEVPVEVPQGSYLVVRCKLKEVVEVGDHYLYICDVDEVLGDEDVSAAFAWGGYSRIAGAAIAE